MEGQTEAGSQELILIVDDEPRNLQVLGSTLTAEGFDVAFATSAKEAYSLLESCKPEVILLDVMMPEISGYEACRTIRSNPQYQDVPVIFLTALSDLTDKIEAFRAGGADYVTKPFESDELMARIRHQVTIRRLLRQTEERRQELETQNLLLEERNRELDTLHQEKTEILGIASHDLKRTISSIYGLANLILDSPEMSRIEIDDLMQLVSEESSKMVGLIRSLLDLNALEQGKMTYRFEELDLNFLLEDGIKAVLPMARIKSLQIKMETSPREKLCRMDSLAFSQVLENLLSNAIKFTEPGKEIRVSCGVFQQEAKIRIQDQGPGFTSEDRKKLYQKFTRLSAQPTGDETSTGLGLSIVKRLCDDLGIGIELLETPPGEGAVFELILPLMEK